MRAVLALLALLAGAGAARRGARVVRTPQGPVRGYPAPDAPPHYLYLGIPYASPPTGNYAFKAPRRPPRWEGVLEAVRAPRCPQPGARADHCLALNVFAPAGTNLPVVVIVHGGGFRHGSGATRAPAALIKQGLIVVTLNYRLGALGFLCLDSPEVSGNAGAKDVLFALYWVQRNIESFGGDKYQITAYGVGAGAAIVEMLLLTGMTEGLIHRAILESGSILSPASLVHDPVSVAYDAAVSLGYAGRKTSDDLLLFYRHAATELLLNISDYFMFVPCVENKNYQDSLLEADPLEILKSRKFHEVPLLISYTEDGGASLNNLNVGQLPEHFEDLLPNNLAISDWEVKHKVAKITKEFYFEEDLDEKADLSKLLANYLNDILVEYPIVKSALLHASGSNKPVYLMKLMNNGLEENGEDSVLKSLYETENVGFDASVLSVMWSNFIKVGDPTPIKTEPIVAIWLPVYNSEDGIAKISNVPTLFLGNGMKMGRPQSSNHLAFWDNIYKNFYNHNHTILNVT